MPLSSILGPFWSGVIGAALLLSSATHFYAQNLTTNGNFEIGPFDQNGTITNWATTAHVTNTNESGALGSHAAALNVGGDYQGETLSQTFPTSAGQWYQVVFDSAIFNQTSSPLQLNVQVAGGTTVLNRSVTPTKPNPNVLFTTYRYAFRANSASATIQFTDIGNGNAGTDTLVDNVSVSATPAPSAVGLPLVNGNFETEPYSTNGAVSGWTIDGSGDLSVESTEGTTQASAHAAVFGAGHDSQSNVLYQTFTTAMGQTYNLDFDAGIFGMRSGGPLQFRVRVFDTATASSLLDQTVLPPEADTFNGNAVTFNHYHFSFNASGSVATLEFSDIGTGAGAADVVLDTVSVGIPTPTPSPTPTPTPTPTPSATPTPPPTALPLNNGSFESPPYAQIGTVTGWTVSGNMNLAALSEGATDGTHSAAFSAGANSDNDILSQSFFTSAGLIYTVDFDAGVYGTTDSSLQLQVKVLGSSFSQTVTPPYAATSDPSQVQFQHYHFTFTPNSSVATLQFTNFLLDNQNADIVLDKVSIVPPPPSYTEWRNAHFNSSQQLDSNISGWSADPDHDGIPNGLEYFANTDPLAGVPAADSNALPRLSIQTSGNFRYLTFTFRRLIGWGGNPAVISVSDNLVSWDTTGNQVETVGNPVPVGDGITETVTVRLKTSLNQGLLRKFVRLQLAAQ